MIKSLSAAALALAMTAGVASAQVASDRQAGAGLFDQGGEFNRGNTGSSGMNGGDVYTPSYDAGGYDGGMTVDREPTGSIVPNGGSNVDDSGTAMYEPNQSAPNNTVPSGSTFGGSSVLFDNSK
jgi:hypothetical protein